MKKPNVFFAGDVEPHDLKFFNGKKNLIVIECEDKTQTKEILMTGKADCTIFGEAP